MWVGLCRLLMLSWPSCSSVAVGTTSALKRCEPCGWRKRRSVDRLAWEASRDAQH